MIEMSSIVLDTGSGRVLRAQAGATGACAGAPRRSRCRTRPNQVPSRAADGIIASVDGTFIPGLRLAGEFYAEAVRPLLDAAFPALRYAAALLGPGSEVLGFDTERSTDHDWGPRLLLFLNPNDSERHAVAITTMLTERLPGTFRGYPVAFPVTREPDGMARHRVQVTELGGWLTGRLGFDPRSGVTVRDWLPPPPPPPAPRPRGAARTAPSGGARAAAARPRRSRGAGG